MTTIRTKRTYQQTTIRYCDQLWVTNHNNHKRRRKKNIEERRQICKAPGNQKRRIRGYTGRPLNLLGYNMLEVQVGKRTIKRTRIVIAREGKKSLVDRDRLAELEFRVAGANQKSEYNKTVISIKCRITE